MYSFGILMWEVLTRKLPFYDMESNEAVMKYVMDDGRPELGDVPSQETPYETINCPH